MKDLLQKYLYRFKNLRTDKAHGVAPHKPLLLISILQGFQNKYISNQRIYITPELVSLFKVNWSLLVESNHSCRFALPFYHLTSDKFWILFPNSGFENLLLLKSSMRNFSNLNLAVAYAVIDDELEVLMKDEASNSLLLQFLLDEYFPKTKTNFINSDIEQKRVINNIEGMILRESEDDYRNQIRTLLKENNEEEIFLRGSIFKREIPKIYNNTCCISGMKIDATVSLSMVDACHIIPFSESYNDTISNGIALCPNLHRAFDRGLISIDSNYEVRVSSFFTEDKKSNYLIKSFEGKKILLPKDKSNFPSIENFKKHATKFKLA